MSFSQASSARLQYPIPHLEVEDKVITVGPLALTFRQTGLLVLGGCVLFDLWKRCQGWLAWGTTGQVLRLILVVTLALICLAWAYGRIYGRTYEAWLLVLWRYWWQPKRCLWQRVTSESVLHAPISAPSGSLLLLHEQEAHA